MDWFLPLVAAGYLTARFWIRLLRKHWIPLASTAEELPPAPPKAPEPVPAAAVAPAPAGRAPSGMPIKGAWECLIGRRIDAVVVNSFPVGTTRLVQVHLVLDGGCNFEIYSPTGDLAGVKGLYRGDLDAVVNFKCLGPDAKVYGDRRLVPRDEDGPQVLWP